jgi:hypothetical protein
MNAQSPQFLKYYIRVTEIRLFNSLVASAEDTDGFYFEALREGDSYVLRTSDYTLWKDLFLYGQMMAQSQGEWIEAGEA